MYKQNVKLVCNKSGCKNEVEADSRGAASKKAAAAGWQLKSASEHYCPDHRTNTAKAVSKKVKASAKSTKKVKKGKSDKRGKIWSFPTAPTTES